MGVMGVCGGIGEERRDYRREKGAMLLECSIVGKRGYGKYNMKRLSMRGIIYCRGER